MAQTIGTRFLCVEQSLFTSASRTKPGSTVIAFAAPQAIPRRMASAIDSPRHNPTAIPAIIASPEPIGFFAFTRGGFHVVTARPGFSDAYTLFAPSVITAYCGPSLTNLRSARDMADVVSAVYPCCRRQFIAIDLHEKRSTLQRIPELRLLRVDQHGNAQSLRLGNQPRIKVVPATVGHRPRQDDQPRLPRLRSKRAQHVPHLDGRQRPRFFHQLRRAIAAQQRLANPRLGFHSHDARPESLLFAVSRGATDRERHRPPSTAAHPRRESTPRARHSHPCRTPFRRRASRG